MDNKECKKDLVWNLSGQETVHSECVLNFKEKIVNQSSIPKTWKKAEIPSQQIYRNWHVLLRTIITVQIPEDIRAWKCTSECHRDIHILQKSSLKNCLPNDRVILGKMKVKLYLTILYIFKTLELKRDMPQELQEGD